LEGILITINGNFKKAEYKDKILRKLPKWFGVEESLLEYVNTVKNIRFGRRLKMKIV
jgi:hypothetical protein